MIQIGILNDVNLDAVVTVQDVVIFVGSWLFDSPVPFPENPDDTIFRIFDGNEDGTLDVADAVAGINRILGRPIDEGIPEKVTDGSPVVVDLGLPELQPDSRMAIPVMIEAETIIAGGEMSFRYDPDLMTVGSPYLKDDTSDLILQSRVNEGVVRLMVISLTGDQGLATGSMPSLMIPVTLNGDRESVLTLDSVTLVNRDAKKLPVRLGDYSRSIGKTMLAPASFALSGNAPNPFNPSTTISYEVPQQANVRLVVYNTLGQEVVTLVNEVKAPGRYTAVWDARNAQGLAVASGIYMYRLSSDAGFAAAKRMTLLK